MQRTAIGVAVDGYTGDAEVAQRAHHADRDLTAIGHEHLAERGVLVGHRVLHPVRSPSAAACQPVGFDSRVARSRASMRRNADSIAASSEGVGSGVTRICHPVAGDSVAFDTVKIISRNSRWSGSARARHYSAPQSNFHVSAGITVTDVNEHEVTASPAVVYVEDDPRIRMMYRINLEADGFAVREAENGEEALELIRADVPDIVLGHLHAAHGRRRAGRAGARHGQAATRDRVP